MRFLVLAAVLVSCGGTGVEPPAYDVERTESGDGAWTYTVTTDASDEASLLAIVEDIRASAEGNAGWIQVWCPDEGDAVMANARFALTDGIGEAQTGLEAGELDFSVTGAECP